MKRIKNALVIGGITLMLLVLIEVILRITGAGFPSGFFVVKEAMGEEKLINNVHYTIPFFSEQLVRTPMPVVMDRKKDENTIRIFIAGESAAMGDPDYSFGAGRILEVILKEQFPDKEFEIVNTAITAVNSNVILPIVKECARKDPDLFIFYMGNNEVIGPYGPTSVFVPFFKSPFLIRASIAVNSTRIGQITRKIGQNFAGSRDLPSKWGGMEMYLQHQLPFNDPRLSNVYRIYQENLRDMCKTAIQNQAGVILCTVASNLRDCSPFASENGVPGTSEENAEFWFEKGNEYLSAGDSESAYTCFSKSRDYDLLRFRCDSRIISITREIAKELNSPQITLLDFEKEIRAYSENGIPGYDLFYEHVHFNFKGNYILAVSLAESIAKALGISPSLAVPSQEFCESRLAFNAFEESEIWRDILLRYQKAPFIQQSTHKKDMDRLFGTLRNLTDSFPSPEQLESSYTFALEAGNDWLIRYNHALFQLNKMPDRHSQVISTLSGIAEEIPHLASLYFNLGYVYQLGENYGMARANYDRALEILPGYSQVYEELAKICVVEGKYSEAETILKKGDIGNERIAGIFAEMASVFARLNKAEKARELMITCLKYNNDHFEANFNLGGYHLQMKEYDQSARYFSRCTAQNPGHTDSYYYLGRAFEGSRKWIEAGNQYSKCMEMDPQNKKYPNSYGKVLFHIRQYSGAARAFSRAIELDSRYYEAYVNLADCYMALNTPDEARKIMNKLIPEEISDPAILNRMSLEFKRLNDVRSAMKCNTLARKLSLK